MREALAPLQAPPFGRLLTTYSLNRLGDYVGIVALALLVYAETRDALAVSALFVAMEFLPAFAAPALTARVDQTAYRRTLPLIYVGEAACFGLLALLAESFSLPLVLALAFVDGVLMLTARGLTRSAVNAALEPRGMLRTGNGLVNLGFAVAGVFGAALGGLLVDSFGTSTALAIDGASFLVVAAVLAGASHLPAAEIEREHFLARVRNGLRFAWAHATVRMLLIGEALALLLFTMIVPIEVLYARETLDTDAAGYGLLLSAWGAGMLAGSLAFLRFAARSPIALLGVSTAAIGVAYVGMGLVTELWAACAWSLLGGAGNGVQWVSVMTTVQEATPAALQARITGLLESVASAMTGVGFVAGGVIVALTTPETAFLAAGTGVLVLVAIGVLVLRPRRRPAAPSGAA